MFFPGGLCHQLKSLSLPDCWIKDFFMAHMYTELQMIKEALQKYQNLIEAGFSKSTYIISQIAVAYHNIRGVSFAFSGDVASSEGRYSVKTALVLILISDIDQALAMFNELRDQDPYRIDNMDTFSNLLYVKVSFLCRNPQNDRCMVRRLRC